MAAAHRSRSAPLAAARSAGRAAVAAPGRLRAFLIPVSWWIGWLGLVALAGVGALALTEEGARPVALRDEQLPLAAVAALATASLIGWGCMQQGEARLRRLVGRVAAALLFVVLPVAASALGFADERGWIELAGWPRPDLVVPAVRYTTPVLVTVGLLALLTWRARPRRKVRWGRGAWWALLVLPYAVLFAVVILHVPAPEAVGGPLTDSLASFGRASLAAQLAIGYFLGDSAAG